MQQSVRTAAMFSACYKGERFKTSLTVGTEKLWQHYILAQRTESMMVMTYLFGIKNFNHFFRL